MISVKKHGIVLEKRNLSLEIEGVLNPAVILENDIIYMFYRAVAKGNKSSIFCCTFSDPLTVLKRSDAPILKSEFDYESHGVEDPRIVKIDNLFYLTYCAYNGDAAFGALTTSSDLKHFQKIGIIVPMVRGDNFRSWLKCNDFVNDKYCQLNISNNFVWDKNMMFFPRRIGGKLVFLHRIKPGIQIIFINEIAELNDGYWREYLSNLEKHIVMDPKFDHELSYIGGGCPPIETEFGWLLIYHGVHDILNGYKYVACAALLDLENPTIELARLPYPLFEPEKSWELKGFVNNVCFPTGAIVIKNVLYIYYGAADERIACASISMSVLLKELLLNKTKNLKT